jgi:ubiquitin fusion degradation protein 1
MNIDDYPMLFELTNTKEKKKTHCGVLEFVADEGVAYLPYWMMQNLLLREGDVAKIQYTKLPKGNYVKLRPQTKDFLDISNPKAVLETTLRTYTCLTVGDSILIDYNNRRYFIDIVEAKPKDAVSIVDTDCEVDFAPPLDYVEPAPEGGARGGASPAVGAGKGHANDPVDLTGGGGTPGASGSGARAKRSDPSAASEATDGGEGEKNRADDGPKFLAFAGGGNRLDGKSSRADLKPVEVDVPTTSLKLSKEFENFIRGPKEGAEGKKAEEKKSSGLPKRKAGKLVFGGARAAAGEAEKKSEAEKKAKEEEKKDAPKFEAFKGTGNRLK